MSRAPQMPSTNADSAAMRIDKWLWHARFFKTRSLATQFTGAGNVRVNGLKQTRASGRLRVGDVLSFALHGHIRIIEVVQLSVRRGPASEAQSLYLDRDPPQPAKKRRRKRPSLPRARLAADARPKDNAASKILISPICATDRHGKERSAALLPHL